MRLIFLLILCSVFVSCAFASSNKYIGADFLFNTCNFKSQYGQDIFSQRTVPQVSVNFTYYLTSILGFEVGYTRTLGQNISITIPAAYDQFGITNFTTLASNGYTTYKSQYDYYIAWTPKFNLILGASVVPTIGVSYFNLNARMNLTAFDDGPVTSAMQDNYYISFSERKLMPRIGIKLQYVTVFNLSLRWQAIWNNTSSLKPTTTRNINAAQILQAKLQNSLSTGLGIFYVF